MNGPYSGIVNEEIQFHSNGTTSENGKVISYLWNFGDGITSTKRILPTYMEKKEHILWN